VLNRLFAACLAATALLASVPAIAQDAKPTPPKTIIADEALIPARFWKPSDPKLDRAAVSAALKAGEIVPGATLGNGGFTLSVRVK